MKEITENIWNAPAHSIIVGVTIGMGIACLIGGIVLYRMSIFRKRMRDNFNNRKLNQF